VLGALAHATLTDVPGIFNVAGTTAASPGATSAPSWASAGWRSRRTHRPGGQDAEPPRASSTCPPETLDLLRFGRGVDNSRYQHSGFRYATRRWGRWRTSPAASGGGPPWGPPRPYRYDPEVEEFFRRSRGDEPRRPPAGDFRGLDAASYAGPMEIRDLVVRRPRHRRTGSHSAPGGPDDDRSPGADRPSSSRRGAGIRSERDVLRAVSDGADLDSATRGRLT